ncbi:hypothetical protein L9F63_009142, partial [Diploptera punctata]
IHPDQKRLVTKAEDFLEIQAGGCTLPCGTTLACGHKCKSICHVIDQKHINY